VHSFVAFIDEAGDDGFTFRPHPEQGSSEWFVLGACIMREKNRAAVMRRTNEVLNPIEILRRAPVHFRKLNHEQRVLIAHLLGNLSMRIVTVPVNKIATAALPDGHTLKGNRRLYFYYTRYILERLSWITRDSRTAGEGNGFCKLIFSRAKNLSYTALKEYLHKLKDEHQTQIDWTAIDPDRIEVLQHEQSVGLRLADAVASGVHCALELSRHGFCEDRYLRLMMAKIYCRNGNYLSYGLKIVPDIPACEPARDNRYRCLDWFQE
jgi:hypothetical protein